MSIVHIPVSFPVDADGFIRRECPKCLRQFKAKLTRIDQQTLYTCPYCTVMDRHQTWWTHAQLEYARGVAAKEVMEPALDRIAKSFQRLGRTSGGLLKNKSAHQANTYAGHQTSAGAQRYAARGSAMSS